MPALSVLLPVRDAGRFLAPSLASLARQTFRDFEIVAVDDGSRDGSGERLERAAAREPRLRVLHTARRGLPAALNLALAHARTPLIARHDADDLSHRERFRLQHDALAGAPAVAVLGCRVRLFPAAATGPGMTRWARWHNALLEHEAIAREALIDSPLAHGTAMIRRAWLERAGGWAERGWAEDMDLWLRLLDGGARFAKLPRALYAWRQHGASATRRDPRYARARMMALKRDALARRFLRDAPRAMLLGTGRSLADWRIALDALAPAIHARDVRRPSPAALVGLEPPLVLAFGAPAARDRWRRALGARGLTEGREFVFIA